MHTPRPTSTLVIDAGHTRIKFGLFSDNDDDDVAASRLPDCAAITYADDAESIRWDEIRAWNPPLAILTGSNASRVEQVSHRWPHHLACPISILADKTSVPLRVDVDAPDKVGIDRLLNGVAANVIRAPEQPVVIVDSGTAVTIDCLDSAGTFVGGAILPGLRLSARALHEYTTSLPHFDVQRLLAQTPSAIGRNTENAIASGLFWGHVGTVKELIEQCDRSLGGGVLLLVTGGAGSLLEPFLPRSRSEPFLSLQGLAITARVNEGTDH